MIGPTMGLFMILPFRFILKVEVSLRTSFSSSPLSASDNVRSGDRCYDRGEGRQVDGEYRTGAYKSVLEVLAYDSIDEIVIVVRTTTMHDSSVSIFIPQSG